MEPSPTERRTQISRDRVANSLAPSTWASHASCLHDSAELLWCPIAAAFDLEPKDVAFDAQLFNHSYAYLLVAGAAIETMLKATLIARALREKGPTGVLASDGRLLRWITTHNLESLAKQVGLTLTEEDAGCLERLGEHVIWAGRYPASKEPFERAIPTKDTDNLITQEEAAPYSPQPAFEVSRTRPISTTSFRDPRRATTKVSHPGRISSKTRGWLVDGPETDVPNDDREVFFVPQIGSYDRIYANKMFSMATAAYEHEALKQVR